MIKKIIMKYIELYEDLFNKKPKQENIFNKYNIISFRNYGIDSEYGGFHNGNTIYQVMAIIKKNKNYLNKRFKEINLSNVVYERHFNFEWGDYNRVKINFYKLKSEKYCNIDLRDDRKFSLKRIKSVLFTKYEDELLSKISFHSIEDAIIFLYDCGIDVCIIDIIDLNIRIKSDEYNL